MPVGKEAEVADAHEAAWQQVEQEAAQELFDSKSYDALLVAVGGVAPADPTLAIVGDRKKRKRGPPGFVSPGAGLVWRRRI